MFFYSYGDHRDLHSFPTRRSSDLGRFGGTDGKPVRRHEGVLWEWRDARQRGPQGGPRDRKSTRLNSSHTVISYAVFCLKKKTKIRARSCWSEMQTAISAEPRGKSI